MGHECEVFTGPNTTYYGLSVFNREGVEQCPNRAVECVQSNSGDYVWMCAEHWDRYVNNFAPRFENGQWRKRTWQEILDDMDKKHQEILDDMDKKHGY